MEHEKGSTAAWVNLSTNIDRWATAKAVWHTDELVGFLYKHYFDYLKIIEDIIAGKQVKQVEYDSYLIKRAMHNLTKPEWSNNALSILHDICYEAPCASKKGIFDTEFLFSVTNVAIQFTEERVNYNEIQEHKIT